MRHRRKKRREGHHRSERWPKRMFRRFRRRLRCGRWGIDPRIRLFAAFSDGRRLDRRELNKGWKTLPARQSRSAEA